MYETTTNWGELATALTFIGGLVVLAFFIPKDTYIDPEKTYTHDPKNYSMVADFEDGHWDNGTWIPHDYYIRTRGNKYSFAKGEVKSFDFNTGRWHLHDGNYGEMRHYPELRGNGEATELINYLKKWDFDFEVIGSEYSTQEPVKKSWWNDNYE